MAPRFYVSPYKNAVAQVPKKDGWWSELPVSSGLTDSSDGLKCASEFWLAPSSTSGSLVCMPYDNPSKRGNKAPSIQAHTKTITNFDVSRFDDLTAAGGDDGKISVTKLPTWEDVEAGAHDGAASVVDLATGRAVSCLSWHSTASSLLAAASLADVAIFDCGTSKKALEFKSTKDVWDLGWSTDGQMLSTVSKDGILRPHDLRAAQTATGDVQAHHGVKPARLAFLANDQILTTGFSRMREREFALWDVRNLSREVKRQRVDSSTGALMPLVDVERSIVYLAGRGDMSLRWVEIGGPAVFTEGITPLPASIAGAALAPPTTLNLMKAEINRVHILSGDSVIPVPIEVPRRQYLDFHSDLFPPMRSRKPAQGAQQWLAGHDIPIDLIVQKPGQHFERSSRPAPPAPIKAETQPATESVATGSQSLPVAASAASGSTVARTAAATVAPAEPPAAKEQPASTTASSTPINSEPAPKSTTVQMHKQPAAATSAPSREQARTKPQQPTQQPTNGSHVSSKERFNPGWSRKFLAGSTPLKPAYFDVKDVSPTIGPSVQALKANRNYFFYPLSGPGGRLAYHPLLKTGRVPTHVHSIIAGSPIVDFELDPFDPSRVYIASEDGQVRIFSIPTSEADEDIGEPVATLSDSGMDRISSISHHPTATSLLFTASEDRGSPSLRVWDVAKGQVVLKVGIEQGQITSACWSPDGTKVALTTKNKKLVVVDPRQPNEMVSCAAHDSIRPSQVNWVDDSHVVSSGFNRTASRELCLYKVEAGSSVSAVARQVLDISPSPLFTHVDRDTNILLLYSRGERTCQAWEVHPQNAREPFARLPAFEHGTLQTAFAFVPKKRNDVKAVEIVRALRLTLSPSEVQVVSFSVPRAKADFFQDDIFVPTADVETAVLTASEWLAGEDRELNKVDLRPEGMPLLSQAPAPVAKISTRDKIVGPVKTDSQKQAEYMDRLFQAAKDDGDEEDAEEARKGNAPADDDDW